ncbi:MAG: ADP-ribosylation factor-like protein [Promethearchaeota archaeon]
MVVGIVLFSWDKKMGSVVDIKYPQGFEIPEDLINKIYMTFAYSEDFDKPELIETSYSNLTILSYCDKTRVPEFGYEIVSLILEEKEAINSYRFKKNLINFSQDIFNIDKSEQVKYFEDNIDGFFKSTSAQKILLLGRAGTGKTTIKKIIFEGVDPKELLVNPLDPTRGLSPSVYSWLDLKIGLFDSSGQELESLLNNKDEYDLAFHNTDAVIYIFDYPTWIGNPEEIITEIQKIQKIIEDDSYSAKLIIFIHKIDLINNENRKETLRDMTNVLKENFPFSIYYTSIHPEFIFSTYNAFYEILASYSKETFHLKKILDDFIKESSKSMFFITNQNNSIISQSTSKDFNFNNINHSHKLIAQITQTFEDLSNNSKIEHLILSGQNNLNLILNNLNLSQFEIKNLICISESLSANKLIWMVGQIRLKIKNLFYFNIKDKS